MEQKISIDQALALHAILAGYKTDTSPCSVAPISRKVIVRSRDAGVQYGTYVSHNGSEVVLKDARQMWSWTAKEGGTLLDCANHGVKAGKFSTVTANVTIIGACAIIDVADKAVESLESAKWA